MLSVVRYVRDLFRPDSAVCSDVQLLQQFTSQQDQAAFTALVERHGPLVWGVCRRALGHTQDAEDAFQATFLVLIRRAAQVSWRDQIAPWLHAVALRVVRKARDQARRRRTLEREASAATAEYAPEPLDDRNDLLDAEIQRLPEKYRRPIVLCYLQGKTYTEAARELGWKEGTVSGRLARARALLRQRLERRGLGAVGVLAPVLPTGLTRNTVRSSLDFAAGHALTSHPAAGLAEGVLRTMTSLRFTLAGLFGLVLLTAGVSFAVARQRRVDPPRTPAPPRHADEKPPSLPKAWAGRWQADLFGDVVALEVKHQGRAQPAQVFLIKDATAVAEVVRAATVEAYQNDTAAGLVPPSFVTLVRRDGSRFETTTLPPASVQADGAMIQLTPAFFTALNRQLSRQEKRVIDILRFLPDGPPGPQTPIVKPSRKGLEGGFTPLEVNYIVDGQLHKTHIEDAETIDKLNKALSIVAHGPVKGDRPQSRSVTLSCKDGSTFRGHIVAIGELFDFDAGYFTLTPAFLEGVNAAVSRSAGRKIDVTTEYRRTDKETDQLIPFRKLLAGAKALTCRVSTRRGEQTLTVEGDELRALLDRMRILDVARSTDMASRKKPLAELLSADGKKVELALLEGGAAVASGPVVGALLEVAGLGRVWIDNQWQYQPAQLAYERQLTEKAKRDEETSRLVCADFPLFLRQVRNVVVNYRDKENEVRHCVVGAEARALVGVLATGRLEKFDWTAARWQTELGDLLDQGTGTLALTPGLGFSLLVVVKSDKEMLVFPHGRLVFKDSPQADLTKAIDAENAPRVELLPRKKN